MTATLVLGLVSVLGTGALQEIPEVRINPETLVRRGPAALFQLPVDEASLVTAGFTQLFRPGTEASARAPERKVICGMTVIQVDPPQTDPGMPVQVPSGRVEFTMRSVTPSICWE